MRLSGLFQKTLAGILVLFAIVIGATSIFSGISLKKLATKEYRSKGSAIASSIASSSVEILLNQNAETMQAIIDQFLEIEGVSYVFILNDLGEIIAHTFSPRIPVQILALHDDAHHMGTVVRDHVSFRDITIEDMGDMMDIASPILAGIGGHVHVGMNYTTIRQQVNAAVKTQISLVFVIFLLSIGIAYLFVNRISKPLIGLSVYAEKVASDEHPDYIQFKAQLGPVTHQKDEVGQLAGVLQQMISRIHEREEGLKAAQAELTQINENLEGLVRERTQELSTKNRILETQKEALVTQRKEIETQRDDLAVAYEDLQKTQDQLVQSEKMAALGQLIAGVAHEINTPLGAIRSSVTNISRTLNQTLRALPAFFRGLPDAQQDVFFALIEKSLQKEMTLSSKEERALKRKLMRKLDEEGLSNADTIADELVDMGIYEHEAFLSLIKDPTNPDIVPMAYKLSGLQRSAFNISTATDRASTVVFALKNYARYDMSGELVEANLADGIETVLTLYHNLLKQGIDIVRNYASIPPVRCYPDELNQVWTNLIHNALQAMGHKGTLTIDISMKNEYASVAITDSGQGIPDEIKDRIFDSFFTTKPAGEGSGLGLGIVRKIIDKHKGEITVDSEPGETTFTVILPLNPDKEPLT